MSHSFMPRSLAAFASAAVLLGSAHLCASTPVFAGTSYESQIAGSIAGIMAVLIIGEFGGTTTESNDATLHKRPCVPGDYEDLREAAKERKTLIAFRRVCRLVESQWDEAYVDEVAYLPAGYCEKLKAAFDTLLAEQIYSPAGPMGEWVIIEYKGIRNQYNFAFKSSIRGAGLRAKCDESGALHVRAPRRDR